MRNLGDQNILMRRNATSVARMWNTDARQDPRRAETLSNYRDYVWCGPCNALGMARMTLTNESVTFYPSGIWIQPVLSDGFWFDGSVAGLLSIMVYHVELDIESTRFYVRAENPKRLR